ncbi:MAG: electron transfer flavoprotein subunit beta/FixA family protein [Armatimonadetes bacterium]|nr:electron transfer flavoprotein subunit beta/FixA family protein [Armatimonadota bacterium]
MNIIVLMKQVPDTAEVRIDPVSNTLVREGVPSIINPFDENAIEEGIRLVEKHGGRCTVLTMGPPQAEEALRRALAMGADEAVHVCGREFAGADTWATSYTLAQAIRQLGEFDLIICGKQTFEGDTAQVGPGVAEQLGIAQATYAIEVQIEGRKMRVKRVLEDRYETLEVRLPALISVVKQINEPRHPRLKNVMAAKKKPITVWGVDDLDARPNLIGLAGSPTSVVRIFAPERHHKGEIIEGETPVVVDKLIEKLRQLEAV